MSGDVAVIAGVATDGRATSHATPLTERVLAHLPGPRPLWLIAWGVSPFLVHEVFRWISQPSGFDDATTSVALGYVNLVGLWGAGRLGVHIDRAGQSLRRLLPGFEPGTDTDPFRHASSVVGPLALALVVLGWYDVTYFLAAPGIDRAALVIGDFLSTLGVSTFLWMYAVTLLGISRVGRRALRLEGFVVDPGLGLRPLGELAFEAFLFLAAITIPIVLPFSTDARVLPMVFLLGLLFVMPAYQIHLQLARAKAGRVASARSMLAEALHSTEPDWLERTDPATLADRAPAVAVAVEIERRALAIQDWPFDASIVRSVATILISVTAAIIARLLLVQLRL